MEYWSAGVVMNEAIDHEAGLPLRIFNSVTPELLNSCNSFPTAPLNFRRIAAY
jgi:hypothetical protein